MNQISAIGLHNQNQTPMLGVLVLGSTEITGNLYHQNILQVIVPLLVNFTVESMFLLEIH
jgi:hypothetical protein